jgi:tRNA threonylcarbamoyladenosine biosynthesis protein TsaE
MVDWKVLEAILHSLSADDTLGLGIALAEQVKPPLFILLSGDLGMGKTVLVRGLARGLGVPQEEHIGSPSFTLVNSYRGTACLLHHVDLYRLETLEEFNSIGLFDLMEDNAIVCIEWGEKVRNWISMGLEIRIEDLGGEERRLSCRRFGFS